MTPTTKQGQEGANRICRRCGNPVEPEMLDDLCWSCDWDLANGGDPEEEPWEIDVRRAEEDYEFDPVNYPKPSWLP